MRKAPIRFANYFDAHHRFIISVLVAVVAFVIAHDLFLAARVLVGWNAFALASLVLAWVVLGTKDPYEARRNAILQDGSATVLFTIVISAATISLLAVGMVLFSAKGLPPVKMAAYIGVSVAAVVLSWMLVHTLFALHYARLYYADAHKKERHQIVGGILFPGRESPDYLDFAYFSFVVGMTCQVSDVQISSHHFRRLALLHGLISFCFNTAILAMFVNIVAGLL
jgi:uncharacterized membrane protein